MGTKNIMTDNETDSVKIVAGDTVVETAATAGKQENDHSPSLSSGSLTGKDSNNDEDDSIKEQQRIGCFAGNPIAKGIGIVSDLSLLCFQLFMDYTSGKGAVHCIPLLTVFHHLVFF